MEDSWIYTLVYRISQQEDLKQRIAKEGVRSVSTLKTVLPLLYTGGGRMP